MTISFLTKKKEGASPIHTGDTPYNHVLKANNNLKNKSIKSMELKISKRFSLLFTMQRYGKNLSYKRGKP